MPGYQACTFSVGAGDHPARPCARTFCDLAYLDTPPAAGRAWVPGCRARTSWVRGSFVRRIGELGKTSAWSIC